MKLPISIFPNVTEYTKANWTGYLKQAKVHLDSYSITEICKNTTTITQRPDGVIVMKKKPHETFEEGDFNVGGCSFTVSEIPANSAMVIVHEAIKDAGDWKTQWTKGSVYSEFAPVSPGTTLNSWSDALKNLVIVSRLTNPLSGTKTFTCQYGYEGYHTVYFAFFDADRLDACLTGNHLKSISVGDKLGLVYWDGQPSNSRGKSISVKSTKYGIDPARPTSSEAIGWICVQDGTIESLSSDKGLQLASNIFDLNPRPNWLTSSLKQAGTIDLSACELTVESFEATKGLQDHLFHVI